MIKCRPHRGRDVVPAIGVSHQCPNNQTRDEVCEENQQKGTMNVKARIIAWTKPHFAPGKGSRINRSRNEENNAV
jgi:hypothetical protein